MAHLSPTTLPFVSWFFGGRVFLGSIGVDVFFIISGVVMGLTFHKRTDIIEVGLRTRGFLASRARKIFPLYIIATILAALIAPLFGRSFPSIDRLILDLLLLPHGVEGRYIDPLIGVGWTLRYELFFYFVVFIGLLLNRRHAVTGAIVAVVLLPFLTIDYYSVPLLFEFLAGFLMARWIHRFPEFGHFYLRFAGFIAAVALFLLAATGKDFQASGADLAQIPRMLIYFGEDPVSRVIAWGIPSLLLVITTASLEVHVPGRLAALGKFTYSLYLMQYFCLPIEHKLIARAWPEWLALTTTLLVLAVVTFLSYSFVEKPFSSGGRSKSVPIRSDSPS
jgi:peptidoglycan/LPS O-acetylase OafA/YrhL